MWWIRDDYPGSWIRFFSIPDPGSELSPSRILKEFKYFNPKKQKNWFLSSKRYDPDCSSRVLDPTFFHPGSRIQGSNMHCKDQIKIRFGFVDPGRIKIRIRDQLQKSRIRNTVKNNHTKNYFFVNITPLFCFWIRDTIWLKIGIRDGLKSGSGITIPDPTHCFKLI